MSSRRARRRTDTTTSSSSSVASTSAIMGSSTTTTTPVVGSYFKTPPSTIASSSTSSTPSLVRYGRIVDIITDEDLNPIPDLWQVSYVTSSSSTNSSRRRGITGMLSSDQMTVITNSQEIHRIWGPSALSSSSSSASGWFGRSVSNNSCSGNGSSSTTTSTMVQLDQCTVKEMANMFINGIDTSTMTTQKAIRAGMRFCYDNIRSRLQMSGITLMSGSGGSDDDDDNDDEEDDDDDRGTKRSRDDDEDYDNDGKKCCPTCDESDDKKNVQVQRLIRDTECAICAEEMTSNEVLSSYPCGHALHTQCFILYNTKHDGKSCPTCQQSFTLGP